MKAWKKGLAILLVVLMMTALAVTAFADDPTPTPKPENQYEGDKGNLEDIIGGKMSFDKYLVLKKTAEVPNVEFKFTIEEGSAGGAANEALFIKPVQRTATGGNVLGYPAFVADTTKLVAVSTTTNTSDTAVVTYSPSNTGTIVNEGGQGTKTVDFMTTKADDEKYAEKVIEISFEDVNFYEPGVYRYTIKEVSSYTTSPSGIEFDPKASDHEGTSCVRYLDVYVIDNSGKLEVAGYVLHYKANAPAIGADKGSSDVLADGDELDDKSTGFSNWYDTRDLEFKKEVNGNQASKDKYFKHTVKITTTPALNDNDRYEVIMDNAVAAPTKNVATSYDADVMEKANNTGTGNDLMSIGGKLYVTGAQLKEGKDFYLQHGNSIRINGLPAGATYTVSEVEEDYLKEEAAVDNYKNNVTGVLKTEDAKLRTDGQNVDPNPDDIVYTSFKNTRNGTIPTGILTVVGPAVAVIALGAVGMGIVLVGKRRREEEEEA